MDSEERRKLRGEIRYLTEVAQEAAMEEEAARQALIRATLAKKIAAEKLRAAVEEIVAQVPETPEEG